MGKRFGFRNSYRQAASVTINKNETHTGSETENDDEVFHTPVLLREVIDGLNIQAGKKYIDATLGGGGHGLEIVKHGGIVLGIDVDREAIGYVESRIRNHESGIKIGEDIVLVKGNFREIGEIAQANGFGQVSGILFDLGASLHQLKTAERGFSVRKDGPLDMRMDQSSSKATAADLINGLYEHELTLLFQKYGEEQLAGPVARAICRAREIKKIETTGELARIIESVKKRRAGSKHPATKVFQALRIAVNDELGNLKKALLASSTLLERGQRLAVISFHSLEDRMVKQFFRKGHQSMQAVNRKPIVPGEEEIGRNKRSRSSKLRIYEKQ